MTDLDLATRAAKEAGKLLRQNFGAPLDVDEATHHDIKLALDKQAQQLITGILLDACPGDALFGEEGIAGNQDSERQWIVDPIDGTVNYFYAIPHFCVSIALRVGGEVVLGVIHEPMIGETWIVEKGGTPMLNGVATGVSKREKLEDSILFVGCGKDEATLHAGLERFNRASLRARKMRMMGSAALGLAYVASGRLDAYVEPRISLWDIAAGKLLVEAAGGKVDLTPIPDTDNVFSIVSTNGKIPIEEIL